MTSLVKPIFLFSLPRSGSTLVQRILACHEDIATVSEPWILLPYLYTQKDRGIYSEYSHVTTASAIRDFCNNLPKGREDYFSEMRSFVLRLYAKAARGNVRYFLDKTPRYHLIIEDIMSLFPEGKFIIMWRNPLAVVASTLMFSGNGRRFYAYKIDLFDGLVNQISAYEKYPDSIHAVRFESMALDGESEWRKLFNYLELPFAPQLLSNFSNIDLKGRMGDKKGAKQYQLVSTEPLNKWRVNLANPLRKAWCRHYLKWIGKDRLAVMGYDLDGLLGDLNAIPSTLRHIGIDIINLTYGIVRCAVELRIIKHKLRALPAWHKIHMHS